MTARKGQLVISGLLGVFALLFIVPAYVTAHEACEPFETPIIKHRSENVIVLDFGCFADHEAGDISVKYPGVASGGDVHVADSALVDEDIEQLDESKWQHIEASVPPHFDPGVPVLCSTNELGNYVCRDNDMSDLEPFECDGGATLPSDENGRCRVEEGIFSLNIGNDDGKEYRYIRLSDATPELISSAAKNVEVLLPPWSVKVNFVSEGSYFTEHGGEVVHGSKSNFSASLVGDLFLEEGENVGYVAYCDATQGVSSSGVFDSTGNVYTTPILECDYRGPGHYKVVVQAVTHLGKFEGTYDLFVGQVLDDFGAADMKSSGERNEALVFYIIIVGSLGIVYAAIASLHRHKLKHERKSINE